MAKFYDVIGYGVQTEIRDGVFEDVITEVAYFGDVLSNAQSYKDGESVNDNLSILNFFSIVADDYAIDHTSAMRYIKWAGTLWTIQSVRVESPRLILRPGGVYHGPTPAAPEEE